MRLTSDFWISALIRRVQGAGGFAYLARRGASDAGAIFIKSRSRLGTFDLYGPAPQSTYEDTRPDERVFTRVLADTTDEVCEARLVKELRFDSDLFLIELEDVSDVAVFIQLADEPEK